MNVGRKEAETLRQDIVILRAIIDAVLDTDTDDRMFRACAAVLKDRQELLAWFEAEN